MIKRITTKNQLIVTGASGRIGRALRAVWGDGAEGQTVLWSARRPEQGIDFVWDIGNEAPPLLPVGAILLHLAGQTRGNAAELAENRRSAAAVCAATQQSAARHVFFMSSAAVYRPVPGLIDEDQPPAPLNDYGRAKLAAEDAMRDAAGSFGLTILRLGNLAGADALLSSARRGPVTLDPIAGQGGGPIRSYIGPTALAAALQGLVARAASGAPLPTVLNLAQESALPMADLLTAYGAPWHFGPPREAAIPSVALSVARLKDLVDLPAATADSVVADLNSLKACWP